MSNIMRNTLRKSAAASPWLRLPAAVVAFVAMAFLHSASADGLIEVGARPAGALSGKIVYTHGGHGYTAANEANGAWTSQRPLLLGMVEDLGNKDQMDCFVDCLFRAGATIVPLRPVGRQPNEVVLDNADPAVTFTGEWSDGKGAAYFGAKGATPYRFAATSASETAVARYSPTIAESGYYPVYAWATAGGNRAADQLYRVRHAGGATEVTVNHRRVGSGLVYLGSYYFEKGDGGCVEISNKSSETDKVVLADMIRFGNGRGDIDRGGGVSGFNRGDEAGLYWVMWHADRSQGVPEGEYRGTDIDRIATVSLAPRYAEYMNREADGLATDRVFVSFHSNAGSGKSRGVLGLHNGNNYATSRTPHQLLLAETLARQINDDLVARAGQFEHDWRDRGEVVTLDRSDIEFGELNNKYIHDEFDATIIETGFHDNQPDAEMLRDPRVRAAIAEATCQGLIQYFHEVDGGKTSQVNPPPAIASLAARSKAEGAVTLTWRPAADAPYAGDRPNEYVIYASSGGYGFDAGRIASGGGTTAFTIAGLDPDQVYFFKIAAKNRGGLSPASEVVACTPRPARRTALIVSGFDRLDRHMNPTDQYLHGGRVDRVRPPESNAGDYAVPHAQALAAAAPSLGIATATNNALADGAVKLTDYDAVFWMLGEESSQDHTFDAAEQVLVKHYLEQGGRLFVSGSEIAWDLDKLDHGRSFCHEVLKAKFVADDAGSRQATGAAGSLFEGLDLSFELGPHSYDVDSPDVIAPTAGATAAMTYGQADQVAAVQYSNGQQRLIVFAYPFETIHNAEARLDVMRRVVGFFGLDEAQAIPRKPIVLTEAANRLHQAALVVDGHNDMPWEVREQAGSDFSRFDISKRQERLQTDIPRLQQGGLDVQFWSVWVPVSESLRGAALLTTLEQIDLVEAMVHRYPSHFALAFSVADIEKAMRDRKIASLIGVEGGHCIEDSLATLRRLYQRGARYMTLTHSDTIGWADSATDKHRHGGLTEFGRDVVLEMNRLGMLVDLSHVSAETMHDALDTTVAPIIFSHSSCRAIANHPRNVPDDVLRRLPENGGVVMINFFSAYIVPEAVEVYKQKSALRRELEARHPDNKAAVRRELDRWSAIRPMPTGDIHDVLDHIDHAVKIAGVHHVGLGSDYDGVSVLPKQLEDVSSYPLITQGLLDRGYSESDIKKILGGNLMRVFREAEQVAKRKRTAN